LEYKSKNIENSGQKKFFLNSNRKYLRKNIKNRKMKPFRRYKNPKNIRKNFNQKPERSNQNLN